MMSTLAAMTCDLHRQRPAAARCPGCQRYFCDECITEHDGRLSCAQCLEKARSSGELKLAGQTIPRDARRRCVAVVCQAVIGLALCWVLYYFLGRLLMAIPADFHDGTLWQK